MVLKEGVKDGRKEKEDAAAAQITSITVEERLQRENHIVEGSDSVIMSYFWRPLVVALDAKGRRVESAVI